ncbi:glycoprotein-N-acetylgalactosamine 3-beta-galactosyltransferase 1-like isoform X2 [Mercenaria mercenaria]|uniref:glycoprotein-N-acetylgalactosamine 3-beta-galactosyltransferase 1-like isoform X2 n=1 Tax=Mercenaria mercenaria TaxID=6596 RepID=UPI00234F267F|nr:glycoprotein-N-acetylgalactosamine 3-beta-galactosyltransferase 1-like isoform X2 [Mercenaria mercenaria]
MFLNLKKVYVDDSEARKLFHEVQIFCWILTTKTGVVTKAAGVNFTWAPRCNKHVFFASAYGDETTLPPVPGMPVTPAMQKVTIDLSAGKRKEYTTANGDNFATISIGDVIFIDTPEGYQNLTEKSREVLQYLYLTELNNFDWFLKADDDTYMIMENLRHLLKGLDKKKPSYLGYQLEPSWYDSPYMSGGAGYIFNKAGLKLLVEKGIQSKGTCRESGSFEDLEVGRCAIKSGVIIYNSVDKFERETFHPDRIHDYIPGPPPQWLYYYSRNKPKGGSECCSQLSISFHRMSTQDMLVFDHLLYKTTVYGRKMAGSFSQFFKYGAVRQLPNGIPTMKTSA